MPGLTRHVHRKLAQAHRLLHQLRRQLRPVVAQQQRGGGHGGAGQVEQVGCALSLEVPNESGAGSQAGWAILGPAPARSSAHMAYESRLEREWPPRSFPAWLPAASTPTRCKVQVIRAIVGNKTPTLFALQLQAQLTRSRPPSACRRCSPQSGLPAGTSWTGRWRPTPQPASGSPAGRLRAGQAWRTWQGGMHVRCAWAS